MSNAIVTLACPFADGHGRQYTLVELSDVDDEGRAITSPALTVSTTQPTLLDLIVNPSGSNPLEVKIRTKAPKPANVTACTVSISDGRIKSDGSAVPPVVITVNLTNPPSQAALAILDSDLPLSVQTEADGAP